MSLRDRLKKGGSDSASGYLQQPAGADNIVPPTDTGVGAADLNSAQSAFGAAFAAAQSKGATPAPSMSQPKKGDRFEDVKSRVHSMLVEGLQIAANEALNKDEVSDATQQLLERVLAQEKIPMGSTERVLLIQELVEEVVGLGPLEPLLRDATISEIMVNGPKKVYVEQGGKLYKTTVTFKDNAHLMHVIERIVSAVGRRVDEKTPMVDARLKDGSRVNAIIPPLALDGPTVSIRKFKNDAATIEKLIGWGSLTPEMAHTLMAAVQCHLNIIISGGTGSGKTTMLNALSAMISPTERIVTIEDSAELQLKQDHVVRLETRPANIEGEGQITPRQLLINSLRMRPDRIVVGECRGGETMEMLQAMNTGHDGSLTTLHSNSPRDAVSRIVTMCMMNDNPLPEKTIRQQIVSAVHLIIQVNRLMDGQRKTTSISEITGMEDDIVAMQEIFRFEQTGVDENGRVIGHHTATGIRPQFADLCLAKGIKLPPNLFEKNQSDATAPNPSQQPTPKKNSSPFQPDRR